MPSEVLRRLRAVALAGLAEPAPTLTPRKRRARSPSGAPSIPHDAPVFSVEPMVSVLRDEAARLWRRCAPPWAPELSALSARGDLEVITVRAVVEVRVPHATWRATRVPERWAPVIVAALTGRELPAVRRAMRSGATRFTRDGERER